MKEQLYDFIGSKIRPIELAAFIKTALRIKRDVFNVMNLNWYLDPVSDFGSRLMKEKIYEPEITHQILGLLNEGDTFVDIGGNEGYFSILASKKVGNTGKVWCVEPQKRLWQVILMNVQINDCSNVQLLPFAASDKKEGLEIILSPSINTGSSTLIKDNRRGMWTRQSIQSTTLDSIFMSNNSPKIKLMKVDIEGYEFFALKGAQNLLANKRIENLIIEFHPAQLQALGQSAEQLEAYLNGYGYRDINGIYRHE